MSKSLKYPHEVDLETAAHNVYYSSLHVFLRAAMHDAFFYEIAGLTPNELQPPYAVLRRAYEIALEQLEEIVSHECMWGEDDFCAICGADGRV